MTKGLPELFIYVNDVTSEWFSRMIMIAIFVILVMGYYKAKDDFIGGIAVGSFGTFSVGLLFWLGGMITGWTFSIVLGVLFVGIILLLVDGKNN